MVATRNNLYNDTSKPTEDETFHDSMTEIQDNSEITLQMLFTQMKKMESELLCKIDDAKTDIVMKLQQENQLLKEELLAAKEDLSKNSKLISALKEDIKDLKYDKVNFPEFDELERDIAEVQQYIRRNNIEICNIPENVFDLEKSVIKIGKAVGVEFTRSDIEACHRLHKKANNSGHPRNVIVRFVNRKNCEQLLRKSKKFSNPQTQESAGLNNRIFINNNLCGYYKMLWGKTKHLYQMKLIDEFWVFNGNINVIVNKNDNPVRITHINDLIDIFPDHQNIILGLSN